MSGVNFQAANQLISGGVEAVVADILGTPDDNGIWYDFKRNGGTIRVRNGLADHDAAFVYAKDHPANDNNAGDGPYRLEQDAVFYYHDFTVVRYALKRGEQHAVNARGTRIFILKSDDLLNGDDEADWDAASDNAEEFARIIDAAPGSIYALEAAPAPQPYGGDPQAKTSEAPELATSSVHRASPGPDRSQIEAFVLTLFKHASPGNWVSLRAFPDHGGNSKPFRITTVKLNGDFNVLIDQAYRDAELAAHYVQKVVFCPPIATFTNPNHAREADLAEGLVLSVECDAHARVARVKLEELLGPATVVVESGGEWTDPETGETEPKLHDHYRMKAPARSKDDQKKLKLARKLAARIVGGDPSNVPLVHPIRWPGSLHRKRDPKPCRIVSLNPDAEIDLDTALEILRKAVGNDDCDTTSTLRPTRSNGKSTQQLPRLEIAEAFKHLDPRQGLGQVIEPLPLLPFAPIKTECGWLRHVHDTSGADQSELLWRDALRVCMFLEQGESLIHEFSNEYKGDSKDKDYNFEATKKKFERARQDKENLDLGYPKCQTICNHGAEHCKTCPHLAKGKSPLNLALQQEGPRKPAGPYTDYGADEPPSTPITWDPAELRVSYSNVPHRPWLYGPYLMRGEITIIAAPGGVGKTALTTGIATAIAVGMVLLDDKIWETDLKVLSINGEDGKAEVTRRMWAFARAHAHQIPEEAPERFYTIGADDERTQQISFLQTNERNISSLNLNGFAVLDSALAALRPDLVMLDPFVVFCSGGNMNDNAVMARVMQGLKILAVKHNCAILIVHHNKKGGERDNQESIGGAAAIVNLPRCALMPVPMTVDEAKDFGVLPSERHRYFRLVNAKPNFTPKSEDSPWYQLHSIEIPNAEPPIYEYGDNVQAVARVTLPLPKTADEAANDQKIQKAILDLIERGKLIEGERYPYSANVSGAKNLRALLDDATTAVKDATAPRQWRLDDLRAVVYAAIDRMKVEGKLYEGAIGKGRFHGSSALYVRRSNPTSSASDDTAADTPEEEHEGAEDET